MDTSDTEKIRVFLCHARRDLESVVWLRPRLVADGFEVFGEPGETLSDEARHERDAAIAGADALLFVLSPFAVISETCLGDVALASALAKPIVPLVVAEADWSRVPAGIFASQAVMLKDPGTREAALRDGLVRLRRNLSRLRTHAELGVRAQNWEARGRPNMLTLASHEVAAAEQWLTEQPDDLPQPSPLLRAFVLANLKVSKQRMWTTTKLSLAAAVAAIAIAGGAMWLRGIAKESERIALERDRTVREQQVRVTQREAELVATLAEAEKRRGEAEAARDRGLLTQARALLWVGDQMRREGDATQAALVGLEVLDSARALRSDASLVTESEELLRASLPEMRERRVSATGAASDAAFVAFSPGGKMLAVAARDRVDILDSQTGAELRRMEPKGLVHSVVFSPDGELLLTGGEDHVARLWNVKTGAAVAESERHPRPIQDVHFSRDGTRYLTAAADGRVRVFDTRRSTLLFTLAESDEPARSAGFTPDGRQVIVHQKGVRIWDLGSRRTIELKDLGSAVDLVALNPDGRHLLVAGADAVIYDLRIRRKVASLRGLAEPLTAASFSSDGKRIAAATRDGTIHIWEMLSGDNLGHLRGTGTTIHSMDFAGQTLAGTTDGRLQVWDASLDASGRIAGAGKGAGSMRDLSGERLLAHARRMVARCLTVEQRQKLALDPEPPRWCVELDKWPFDGARWKGWLTEKRAGRAAAQPTTR
jgi:hypothetical protein